MNERFMARLFAVIVVVVMLGWIVSFLAPIFVVGYKPAPEINIVVMAIVGLFVTLYTKTKNPEDGDDE